MIDGQCQSLHGSCWCLLSWLKLCEVCNKVTRRISACWWFSLNKGESSDKWDLNWSKYHKLQLEFLQTKFIFILKLYRVQVLRMRNLLASFNWSETFSWHFKNFDSEASTPWPFYIPKDLMTCESMPITYYTNIKLKSILYLLTNY